MEKDSPKSDPKKEGLIEKVNEKPSSEVVNQYGVEYRRDVEGCIDYLDGGALSENKKRYDERSNSLVEEEIQQRHDGFSKLNLPAEEMLKTETDSQMFPDNNQPFDKVVRIDKETIAETIHSTGSNVANVAKSFYSKMVNVRERRRQTKIEKESRVDKDASSTDNLFSSDVTHIKEVLRKEPDLKTIEEMKKPELASYPIMNPKTVEVIQDNQEENVEKEIREIKKIVEPDVLVAKDLPQQAKDPFVRVSPKVSVDAKSPLKKLENNSTPSFFKKYSQRLWISTKTTCQKTLQFFRESDVAGQAVAIGASTAVLMLLIAKRKSFYTFRSIEDLHRLMKSPFQIHAAIHSVKAESGILYLFVKTVEMRYRRQLPFPHYFITSSIQTAAATDISSTLQCSLLALNMNEHSTRTLLDLINLSENKSSCFTVLFYPSDVNTTIPNNILYGDISLKGLSTTALTRWKYHSISRYLVRMGLCSIDRDINIDVNKKTMKYMRHLGSCEVYAVRRKLGMWEHRTSTHEDNLLVRGWYCMYRPFYHRFVYPRRMIRLNKSIE